MVSVVDTMELSPTQKAALLDHRRQVLVSAGAGSGKTRLLVAYFVRALVDEGIPAERLMAVTFTRKAAGELTSRIRESLEACGRPDLARALDSATIGTIHGLCRRLIGDRSLDAGVDPAFRVIEAEAARLLKHEISGSAWDMVAEKAEDAVLEVLATRSRTFQKEVVALYDRLRGMGFERPQIDIPEVPSDDGAEKALIIAVEEALTAGRAVERPGVTLQDDLAKLRDCLGWLEGHASLDERAADLEATSRFFPSRRTAAMALWFEPVREALTGYRRVLAAVRLKPVIDAMNLLLCAFHEEYEARKRERGLLDFNDLELRARSLVEAANGGGSMPILPGCRVLIDEFQDTNEVQCGLLEGLGAERILMVGDKRQSIYRFRGADVHVFSEREQRLEADDRGEAGSVHRLRVNYRSRETVLDFINALFSHQVFFGPGFDALCIPQPDEAAPRTAAAPPTEAAPPAEAAALTRATGPTEAAPPAVDGLRAPRPAVEVLVAERHQSAESGGVSPAMQEAEAQVVADRIRRAVDGEGRRQREVVLLLPSQTHVDLYQQALVGRGLDVYVVRGKGYYAREEITDIISLLRVLVNPHDDLALLAVMRSPLVGLSDDALFALGRRKRGQRMSLWGVIRDGGQESLGKDDRGLLVSFMGRLAQLQPRVGRPGLARLIEDAIDLYDYDLCVLAAPDGQRRFANVRKLTRIADGFEGLEGPDLAKFVRTIQSLDDLGDDEGSAPTLAEAEDVVRIMTVHQAKGLEFPVVVLAGLGSDVRYDNASEFVVGHDGRRMGVFLKGSRNMTYETEDLSWGPAVELTHAERIKELEEDNRLLYVAMTRAQDRLVLVGARPKNDNLEKCRIGRIVMGLGQITLPKTGETVRLAGLDAVIEAAVPPTADEVVDAGENAWPVHTHISADFSVPKPPAGLAPAPVAGRPLLLSSATMGVRQVSFSALAAYHRCPRRFYFERILGLGAALPEPVWRRGRRSSGADAVLDEDQPVVDDTVLDDEERASGRDVGLLVHALLERLPLNTARPAEGLVRETAVGLLRESGVRLSSSDCERTVALALSFWDSPLYAVWSHPAAMREAPFFFAVGDMMVSGIMDLVIKGEESWQLVDYKTNVLRDQSPADMAAGYELQIVTYCLAALLAGAPAVRMDLVFLERPREPVTAAYSREDIPRLQDHLGRALEGIERREFSPLPGEHCRWCPVAELCGNVAPA